MSRSRKDKLTLQEILAAPWWVSAWVGVLAFIAFQWLFPAVTSQSLILRAFAQGLKPLGYVVALFFGFIALVSFFRQSGGRTASPRFDGTREHRVEPSFSGGVPKSDRVMDAWEASTARSQEPPAKPTEWSINLLRLVEWKRFEELVAAFYREIGLRTETIRYGADGGIDAKLYREGSAEPTAVVQCKAWNSRPVGVKPVRELLGVMTHEKVPEGIFMITGDFSDEATAFAKSNPIDLVNGKAFLGMIQKLSIDARKRLLDVATEGDFMIPTCPSCGIKMVHRDSKTASFWGCSNYPTCKNRIFMKGGHA